MLKPHRPIPKEFVENIYFKIEERTVPRTKALGLEEFKGPKILMAVPYSVKNNKQIGTFCYQKSAALRNAIKKGVKDLSPYHYECRYALWHNMAQWMWSRVLAVKLFSDSPYLVENDDGFTFVNEKGENLIVDHEEALVLDNVRVKIDHPDNLNLLTHKENGASSKRKLQMNSSTNIANVHLYNSAKAHCYVVKHEGGKYFKSFSITRYGDQKAKELAIKASEALKNKNEKSICWPSEIAEAMKDGVRYPTQLEMDEFLKGIENDEQTTN